VVFDSVDSRSLILLAIDGNLFSFSADASQMGALCTPRLVPYDHTSSLDCHTKLTERRHLILRIHNNVVLSSYNN